MVIQLHYLTCLAFLYGQVPEESAELTIGGQKFPYPYSDEPTAIRKEEKQTIAKNEEKPKKTASDPGVPEYRIVHRGHIDFQNFTHARLYIHCKVPTVLLETFLLCLAIPTSMSDYHSYQLRKENLKKNSGLNWIQTHDLSDAGVEL